MSIRSFASGWCTAGNHQHCRGALPRPGGAEPWLCICKCHKGKEVTLPEEIKREYKPGSRNPEQLDKFKSDLIVYGKCSVDLPDSDEELAAIRGRMHNAARKAKISVAITIKGDKVIATKARKKRAPRKGKR